MLVEYIASVLLIVVVAPFVVILSSLLAVKLWEWIDDIF